MPLTQTLEWARLYQEEYSEKVVEEGPSERWSRLVSSWEVEKHKREAKRCRVEEVGSGVEAHGLKLEYRKEHRTSLWSGRSRCRRTMDQEFGSVYKN